MWMVAGAWLAGMWQQGISAAVGRSAAVSCGEDSWRLSRARLPERIYMYFVFSEVQSYILCAVLRST